MAIQLAGNALTDYPYFEFVGPSTRMPDQVAIDPTLHPEIVGRCRHLRR